MVYKIVNVLVLNMVLNLRNKISAMNYTNYINISGFPVWKKSTNATKVLSSYSISFVIYKFLNCIIKKGKKARAVSLLHDTLYFLKLYNISQKTKKKILDPMLIIYRAILNSRPYISLTNKKRGRRNVSTPCIMKSYRSLFLASSNIINAANSHRAVPKGKQEGKKKISTVGKLPFSQRLALELLKSYLGIGKAVDKRLDLHRKAYAQRTELRIYYRKKKRVQRVQRLQKYTNSYSTRTAARTAVSSLRK